MCIYMYTHTHLQPLLLSAKEGRFKGKTTEIISSQSSVKI